MSPRLRRKSDSRFFMSVFVLTVLSGMQDQIVTAQSQSRYGSGSVSLSRIFLNLINYLFLDQLARMRLALARRIFNGYPALEMADIVQARLTEGLRLVAGKVQIAVGGGPHHCSPTA